MTLSRRAATAIGFSAVLLWASLSTLTAASGTMPPFQLLAMTFAIGGLAGVALWTVRPSAIRALRQPWPVWLLGVGGLFGYHAAYFIALRHAPVVEAGLINYLWPLLIVLFSALLPGRKTEMAAPCRLRPGADRCRPRRHPRPRPQPRSAIFARLSRGIVRRRGLGRLLGPVPPFRPCLERRHHRLLSGTAALATIVHFAIEPTVWPTSLASGPPSSASASARSASPSMSGTSASSTATSRCWAPPPTRRRCSRLACSILTGFAAYTPHAARRLPADHRRRHPCRQRPAVPALEQEARRRRVGAGAAGFALVERLHLPHLVSA